jgi:hypothetical protein
MGSFVEIDIDRGIEFEEEMVGRRVLIYNPHAQQRQAKSFFYSPTRNRICIRNLPLSGMSLEKDLNTRSPLIWLRDVPAVLCT